MARQNIIYVFVVILLVFNACRVNRSAGNFTGDSSATSLDWEGKYEGTVPCADCEGIKTSLQLNRDKSYKMTRQYLGKSRELFESEGSFEWSSMGNTIQLDNMDHGPDQYLVGENNLFQLDLEGNRITGELADNYILKKTGQHTLRQITSKKWRLIELMGNPIAPELLDEAYIFFTLDETENRITGFGGCNNFFGQYELKSETGILFSKLGRTQKYCQDVSETETAFFKVMETVDNFTINEDGILHLNRARMATMAKFEVVGDGLEETTALK